MLKHWAASCCPNHQLDRIHFAKRLKILALALRGMRVIRHAPENRGCVIPHFNQIGCLVQYMIVEQRHHIQPFEIASSEQAVVKVVAIDIDNRAQFLNLHK
jgi:hypothetical protein